MENNKVPPANIVLTKHLLLMLDRTEQSSASIEEMEKQPEWQTTIDAMLEFAKLHVEAYRKNIHKEALIVDNKGTKALVHGLKDSDGNMRSFEIDKHSITNCYPLSNIK